MTKDLIILFKEDRNNLENLAQGFSLADRDSRARRVNDATNHVAMFVQGENEVIYPCLQSSVEQGSALVEQSLTRLRSIVDDFDALDRLSLEDSTYPTFFDESINRFFDHWEHENRAVLLLRNAMKDAEFNLLGPRWITAKTSVPTCPQQALRAAEMSPAATAAGSAGGTATEPQPPSPEHLTLSQHMHKILDQAQEMFTRVKLTSGGDDKDKATATNEAPHAKTKTTDQASPAIPSTASTAMPGESQKSTATQASAASSSTKACGHHDACDCAQKVGAKTCGCKGPCECGRTLDKSQSESQREQ
ncbi:hypothetical protein BGZ83_001428 [Gryganskiella cystojenkinii]|nr:hypothetical protein BGZ83_001428 [Gryganskiella cystojenkinii]